MQCLMVNERICNKTHMIGLNNKLTGIGTHLKTIGKTLVAVLCSKLWMLLWTF